MSDTSFDVPKFQIPSDTRRPHATVSGEQAPRDEKLKQVGQGRIGDIELLRAIAILFVLIEHLPYNLFPWLGIGGINSRFYYYFGLWNGVDLFLAISGFVIARSLLPQLEATTSTAGFLNATIAFWVRRVWRLLPSAWLWLAIIMLCVFAFNSSSAFGTFRANFEGAIAGVLDVANFRILQVFNRFEPGASFPYWSLSLEEQFYILLPVVVFFSRRWLPQVLIAIVLAQIFITRSGPETSYLGAFLNQTRSDALCLGVLIAIWGRHTTYRLFEPVGLKTRPVLRVVILSLVLLLFISIGSHNLHLGFFQVGIVAVISAALVVVASYDQDYLCPDGMFKRAMLWIGSRSYGIYLIHIPAYLMTREIWYRIAPSGTVFTGTYTVRYGLTAICLLAALAELNYRLVELPLRKRGARIAQNIARRAV